MKCQGLEEFITFEPECSIIQNHFKVHHNFRKSVSKISGREKIETKIESTYCSSTHSLQ
jgi:hypothetical protein